MSNISTMQKHKITLAKKLSDKKLTYKKVNLAIDLYSKILIEECRRIKSELSLKPEASMFFDRCFDYLINAVDDANNFKVIESANKIRDAYESFLVSLCFEHEDNFNFDIDLRTENTREFVLKNTDKFFGEIKFDYYKGIKEGKTIHEFKYFYDWISKIIHPTTLKLFVMELEKDDLVNKYYVNIFKENIFYMIMIILTYLENRIDPSDNELFFHKEMIKAIIPAHFINLIYFCASVNKNKIAKYSILFNTDNDKKYIENMSENAKKSKEEFDKMLSNNDVLIIDGKFVEEIMREKGYFELFSQELKSLLGSGYKL